MRNMATKQSTNQISKMIWGCDFNRCGQIEYNSLQSTGTCLAPCSLNRIADLHSELGFRLRKRFRAVLISEDRSVLFCTLFREAADEFRMRRRELNGLFSGVFEDYVPE